MGPRGGPPSLGSSSGAPGGSRDAACGDGEREQHKGSRSSRSSCSDAESESRLARNHVTNDRESERVSERAPQVTPSPWPPRLSLSPSRSSPLVNPIRHSIPSPPCRNPDPYPYPVKKRLALGERLSVCPCLPVLTHSRARPSSTTPHALHIPHPLARTREPRSRRSARSWPRLFALASHSPLHYPTALYSVSIARASSALTCTSSIT
jgi:hypothetical protein